MVLSPLPAHCQANGLPLEPRPPSPSRTPSIQPFSIRQKPTPSITFQLARTPLCTAAWTAPPRERPTPPRSRHRFSSDRSSTSGRRTMDTEVAKFFKMLSAYLITASSRRRSLVLFSGRFIGEPRSVFGEGSPRSVFGVRPVRLYGSAELAKRQKRKTKQATAKTKNTMPRIASSTQVKQVSPPNQVEVCESPTALLTLRGWNLWGALSQRGTLPVPALRSLGCPDGNQETWRKPTQAKQPRRNR